MADAADELFHPTASQSIWKVTRQLKKEQSSLYNCVASVLSDAAFVSEVRSLYPSLSLLANLRCGLWYTRQADGTCYFKSTDGHNGNWSFSSTRLNWNVCELAAKQGGVIIVDATRKGKRFPDAMTKTIPIWAAVVNRAVVRKRAEAAARMAAAEAASAAAAAAAVEVLDAAAAAGRHQEPKAELTAEAYDESGALGPAPPGLPGAASPLRDVRRDRRGSCSGAAAMPPPLQCAWAAWSVADGDVAGGSTCARVGSLSQWLQSPVAAAVKEDEGQAGPLPPRPKTHCPQYDSHDADRPAPPLPYPLSGCGGPAPAPGCQEGAPAGLESHAGLETYAMELDEEASFGEVGEMSPDGDQPPPHQPLVVDTVCSDRPPAAAPEQTGDGACLYGIVPVPCCDGAGPEPPTASTARLSFSPFAVAAATAAAAAALEAHESAGKVFAAVVPTASRGDASVASPSVTLESSDSVDLGAASASHVSCSPEEAWRWGGLFRAVVNDSEELLRLCCTCDSWECSSSQWQQQQHRCPADTDAADADTCGGAGACPQRTRRVPQDSDADLDGSGGSCSDACGPAGLSGPASTRASSSSSSSSGCVSRRSSFSSGHSGIERQARAGAGRPACPSAESAPRLRPFPRHHTCSPSAPPTWSPGKVRRCSLAPSRAAAACGGGGGSSTTGNGGCTFADCSSSGSSSSGGSSTCGASAADEPAPLAASSGCAGAACACVDGGECWDVGLHLPLWISSNERAQIERRLDGWVDALLRVGADVEGLAKVLRKPLRPLWISQSSTIWVDQVAQPDQLPFTPLYLVSASQPHSYLRQAACVGGGGGGSDADADADGDSSDGRGAAPRRHPHHKRPGQGHGHRHHDQQQQQQPHAWTYVYVPGAGDDEESWAAGLTPAVFWAHYTELLQAGPAGVHDAVRQVLQREAAALAERGTNSSILAAAATHGSAAVVAAGAYAAPTDAHHLMPAGCRGGSSAAAAAAAGIAAPGPGGLYFIGPTGIALGDLAAGAAQACWSLVDAVLCCGPQQHPSMAGEPQWPHGELPPGPEEGPGPGLRQGQPHGGVEAGAAEQVTACAAAVEAKASGGGCGGAKEGEEGVATANNGESLGSLVGADVKQQHHHHHHHHHHRHHQQGRSRRHWPAPRYLHLPVQHYKHHRTSLLQHLGLALEFLSHHLSRGHRVLIHDTNGLDSCVCVAVALLLACYGPCSGNGGEAGAPTWVRPYRAGGGEAGAELSPEAVSKCAVRQRLAYVSGFYPPARPTRSMLRQVFNHFVSSRADGAEAGGGGDGAAGCEEEVEE